MNDDAGRAPLKGELMPALSRFVSLAPEVANLPQGLLGSSLFARARYASEQKQFEAYTRLVDAKNSLLRALDEQQKLMVTLVVESERARHLDDLREIARQAIRNELNGVYRKAELSALQHETDVERLTLERDRMRRARLDFSAPPAGTSPPKKPSLAEGFDKVGGQIEEIERAHDELRSAMIKRAGGEQNLTDDTRHQLMQFELLRDNLINRAMEELY